MPAGDAVLCVVQARMGSTRLPGKVLADLAGRPMLAFQLERLAALREATVVVATSTLERDDPVAAVAAAAGVGVVRGPEDDVLGRFAVALDRHPADHVVRLTADCPLTDDAIVRDVLELHLDRGADYTCNVLPRTFPKGLDVEVMAAPALRTAHAEAAVPFEREHVTPHLYRHPERFRLANLRSGDDLGDEWWTVDTPADLDAVRAIVARMGGTASFGWREALAVVGRRALPAPGSVHLRPAGPQDEDRLRRWRNDAATVRASLSAAPVGASEHRRWLAGRLADPGCRLWIAEIDAEPVGMVRIEVEGAVGTVSIAVAPERRGAGVGTRLLAATTDRLASDLQVDVLVASVRTDNEASHRAFLRTGFVETRRADGVIQLRRALR